HKRLERYRGSNYKVHRAPIAVLSQREVHLQTRCFFQSTVSHIAYDTDHLPFVAPEKRNLIDRFAIGPEPARHRLIYNQYFLGFTSVVLTELSAATQRDFHGANVAGIDHSRECVQVRLSRICDSLGPHTPASISTHRQRVGQAGRLNTWNFRYASRKFLVKGFTLRARLIFSARLDAPRRRLFRSKSWIDFE